ncbi:MAG: cytochrome C biogenesis protein, partial [Haliea sp.]|nr:cytochrome C biogenesis protein [Haliea sp.]
YQLGWRSQTAVRFTLGGFIVLMLAFLGSKLVLELVLQRG